jgi:hypothetical protein
MFGARLGQNEGTKTPIEWMPAPFIPDELRKNTTGIAVALPLNIALRNCSGVADGADNVLGLKESATMFIWRAVEKELKHREKRKPKG